MASLFEIQFLTFPTPTDSLVPQAPNVVLFHAAVHAMFTQHTSVLQHHVLFGLFTAKLITTLAQCTYLNTIPPPSNKILSFTALIRTNSTPKLCVCKHNQLSQNLSTFTAHLYSPTQYAHSVVATYSLSTLHPQDTLYCL